MGIKDAHVVIKIWRFKITKFPLTAIYQKLASDTALEPRHANAVRRWSDSRKSSPNAACFNSRHIKRDLLVRLLSQDRDVPTIDNACRRDRHFVFVHLTWTESDLPNGYTEVSDEIQIQRDTSIQVAGYLYVLSLLCWHRAIDSTIKMSLSNAAVPFDQLEQLWRILKTHEHTSSLVVAIITIAITYFGYKVSTVYLSESLVLICVLRPCMEQIYHISKAYQKYLEPSRSLAIFSSSVRIMRRHVRSGGDSTTTPSSRSNLATLAPW